jgi:hypothetical protein
MRGFQSDGGGLLDLFYGVGDFEVGLIIYWIH